MKNMYELVQHGHYNDLCGTHGKELARPCCRKKISAANMEKNRRDVVVTKRSLRPSLEKAILTALSYAFVSIPDSSVLAAVLWVRPW